MPDHSQQPPPPSANSPGTMPDSGSPTSPAATPPSNASAAKDRGARSGPWRLGVLCVVLVVGLGGLGYQRYWSSAGQRFQRALAALDRGDPNGVRKELPGWPASPAYEPHRHFLAGGLLILEGQPALALDELGYAANTPELQVRTLTLAGQALYQLGQQFEAITPLTRAVAADDKAVDAHRWLASCYYDLGAIHQALSHLEIIAQLAPQDARPHRLIGLMHKDFEHYDEAIAAYRESLRRNPTQAAAADIQFEMAECQVKQRKYVEALETLAKCSDTPPTWVLSAECRHATGQQEQATELVDRALAKAPDALAPLLLAATFDLEGDRVPQAVERLEKAVAKHPRDYEAHFKLAQAYRRAGQDDKAVAAAKTSEELKSLRDVFTQLHQQAADAPQDANLRFRLGQTALALGRPDLAQVWFRMALAINPSHSAAAAELAKLNH
jgi:tetratricopeptide (TPR) repeat protein